MIQNSFIICEIFWLAYYLFSSLLVIFLHLKLVVVFYLYFCSYLIKPCNLAPSQGEYLRHTSEYNENWSLVNMSSLIFHMLMKHPFLPLKITFELRAKSCDISFESFHVNVCVILWSTFQSFFQEIQKYNSTQ